MKRSLIAILFWLALPVLALTQGISCPAVIAGPDTTLPCNNCVQLQATPVSGFQPTSYNLQQIPYNPYPYNSGTSILVNTDDIWSGVLPIGFNFCYYGQTYNQCLIGSNGVLSFDLSNANGYCAWVINQGIPGNADVPNSILSPFHDIDPGVGGSIYWAQYGQAPCRVFVVSFYQIPMFSCNNLIATQQIVLYETTNIVEVYIQNKPTCSTWNSGAAIEGIQNQGLNQATPVPGRNYPTQWTASNDAYAFVPAGPQNYTIQWFEVGNPVALTNLDTITVCPSGPTDYYAEVTYTNCNGSTVVVRDTASIIAASSAMTITEVHNDASCNGGNDGSATISITGNSNPYTILWSNGQTTASIGSLPAGTYTVTVTEQGGCAGVSSVTIGQPAAISLVTNSTNPLCNGQSTGTASVTASGGAGGFAYLWSNGSNQSSQSGLAAGSYTVTVTDASGCTNTATVTITQPTNLNLNLTHGDVSCFGAGDGTANASVNGGTAPYTYLWSNGANTANQSNLTAGAYGVTVTDANGCIRTGTVTVIEPAVLTLQTTNTNVSCNGGSNGTATSTVGGGTTPYNYLWSNGATSANLNGLNPGVYILTVTDAHGCTATSSVTVTQPTALQIQMQHTDLLCPGQSNGTANVTVSGGTPGYTYLWSNGSNQPSVGGLPGGTYTVTVTDANSCTIVGTAVIAEPPALTLSLAGTDILCHGLAMGTITSTVGGGTPPYGYHWSNGSIDANPYNLVAGTYALTVTDANGCTISNSISLTEPDQIQITITGDNTRCEYEDIDLESQVTGGVAPYSYQWYSIPTAAGDTTPNLHYYDAHESRDYVLNITDANGCHAQASYFVESFPQPSVDFIADRTQMCDSGTVLFVPSSDLSPLGYAWEFSDGQTSVNETPTHWFGPGFWSVSLTVITDQGCTNTATHQDMIQVIATPEAAMVSDPNLTLLDHLLLSQASVMFNSTSSWWTSSVNWSFGNGDSSYVGAVRYTFPDTGRYCVTITAYNQFGCHDDSTQCITILPDPFLWVPTGFTPNGDGLNDIFLPGGINLKEIEMWIYDRWGRMIFHTAVMGEGWDGKFQQEYAPEDAYVFKINAVNNEDKRVSRAGTVTLVR